MLFEEADSVLVPYSITYFRREISSGHWWRSSDTKSSFYLLCAKAPV